MYIVLLLTPYILLLLAIVACLRLLRGKVKSFIAVLLIIVCVNYCTKVFPINRSEEVSCGNRSFKVLTWNVSLDPTTDTCWVGKAQKIAKVIERENPDVVYLTEYYFGNLDVVLEELKKMSPDWGWKYDCAGESLFVRKQIGISRLVRNEQYVLGLQCTFPVGVDDVQIVGCHLSSNNFNADGSYMTPSVAAKQGRAREYFSNTRRTSEKRSNETAEILRQVYPTIPTILMGDYNDVLKSPCINTLAEAGFKDAWWEKGIGYGATIHHPLPFRIDHVMYRNAEGEAGSQLRLRSIKVVTADGLSDHDALMAEFEIE